MHNAGLQRTLSGTEGHARFEVSGMRSTSEKFTHLLPGQEDGEVNGSELGTELRTWKKDNHGMKPEANGNHFPTQVSSLYLYFAEPDILRFAKLFYYGGYSSLRDGLLYFMDGTTKLRVNMVACYFSQSGAELHVLLLVFI